MPPAAALVLPLSPPRQTTPTTSPAGLADSLIAELARAIIRLAAEDPHLVAQVRSAVVGGGGGVTADRGPLLMRKADYAIRIGYGVRTLDKFIDAGLPIRGRGKLLRIVVPDADEWLLTRDAENLDEVDLLAMQNARKRRRSGANGG